jgi:hypothetical protein
VFWQISRLTIGFEIVISDCLSFCAALFRTRTALAAENLFLRKQLALFQEREKRAKPTAAADRFVFSKLARFFDWPQRIGHRQTSHVDRLASSCFPETLAFEVETSREAASLSRGETLDPPDGSREPDLG